MVHPLRSLRAAHPDLLVKVYSNCNHCGRSIWREPGHWWQHAVTAAYDHIPLPRGNRSHETETNGETFYSKGEGSFDHRPAPVQMEAIYEALAYVYGREFWDEKRKTARRWRDTPN